MDLSFSCTSNFVLSLYQLLVSRMSFDKEFHRSASWCMKKHFPFGFGGFVWWVFFNFLNLSPSSFIYMAFCSWFWRRSKQSIPSSPCPSWCVDLYYVSVQPFLSHSEGPQATQYLLWKPFHASDRPSCFLCISSISK